MKFRPALLWVSGVNRTENEHFFGTFADDLLGLSLCFPPVELRGGTSSN